LRLYEIQAGTVPDDVKAEELANYLLETVSVADARDAVRRNSYSRDPEKCLTADSLVFLGSAEHLAKALTGRDTLEWSGPIIGLCKAVERELIERFLSPLRSQWTSENFTNEFEDPDLGPLARWVAGRARPPELGTLRHALLTATKSKRRAETSVVIKALKHQASQWPRGRWLLDSTGLPSMLRRLTDYRNDAAHLGSMGPRDYQGCRGLVIGADGLVWRLLDSTAPAT
jgi:hypothetical protein